MIRLGVDGRELQEGIRTGIGRYLLEVLRAASQAGWQCIVYANRGQRIPVPLPGTILHLVDETWTWWWDQIKLSRLLAHHDVSAFLSPYYKGPLFTHCPTVITVHDLFFIRYPGSRRPCYDTFMAGLAKLYARRATAIITDSDYSKRSVVDRLGVTSDKVHTIPIAPGPAFRPGALTDHIKLRYRISIPYILYVGNFKPHKNLPRLLEAYTRLEQSIRNRVQLIIAGEDQSHQPTLQALAESLGIAERVSFPGFIAEEDLPEMYSGAALVVLPSLVEGYGLPALEAMACGAPVVAANRAAIPEVVGRAAVLVDPDNVASIAEAMTQVLTQTEYANRLRQLGLARASEFTPERTSGRVLSLLRRISRAEGSRNI